MKYKLIKEYPGSPRLNTVIDDEITTFGVSFAKNNLNSIENHSEFWQLIIEKDYEILATFGNNDSLERTIFSVKRLSDGEIFTIGDSIELEDDDKYEGKIDTIFIAKTSKRKGQVLLSGLSEYGEFHNIGLIEAVKYKQPLLTTEDGVDIFEGDLCTTVTKYKFSIANKSWKPQIDTLYQLKNNDLIAFSTKEKAEEYILLNKPCLSLKDVKLKLSSMSGTIGMRMLRELVKSKI